jgi:hypothetical protein
MMNARVTIATGILGAVFLALTAPVFAQQQIPIRPGEAFVTRFSGTATVAGPGGTGLLVINPAGVVGSVIDLRNPGQPPQGQHWISESQRTLVTAAEVGQVFGVAMDDNAAPSIYLAATAAFGLHTVPGSGQWMPGMWGSGGGPGTIYRLGPSTGYRPQPFAQITLGGRPNSGASLGNIAYDRSNRQLYVTDLETGMIHRIRAADGADLGAYDHGTGGRSNFLDAATGRQSTLPPIPFNPSTRARIADCPSGRFDNSPECWNIAPSGRRVWGVGVWRNGQTGEVRVFYSAWSGPNFDPQAWLAASDEDKRNSVWSVGIGPDGSFNMSSVRREFIIPDFFTKPEDIARAGFSQPVSDIAFPASPGLPLMLVAERGGMRNLGLGEQAPFATPHEARAIRYELHQDGVWRPIGRYEVGFYDRATEGEPRIRANAAGGVSFGPAYSNRWVAEQSRPDNYVWITGDDLCSPNGPCNLPASGAQTTGDDSEVHGVQGIREDFFAEVAPASAYGIAPEQQGSTTAVIGPDEAYLVDVNINMTPAGAPIPEELLRNDATLVGDVFVFQQFATQQPLGVVAYPLPPAPPVLIAEPGHESGYSHARYGSHGQQQSHFRFASHWPAMSHQRFGSHNEFWSHNQYGSHNANWSHNRFGSHGIKATHNALGSHQPVQSHFSKASKVHILQFSHKQFASHSLKESIGGKHSILESIGDKGNHTLIKSLGDKGDPKHSILKSLNDKGDPKHTVLKSLTDKGDPKHTILESFGGKGDPKHTLLKSIGDKGADPKHTVLESLGGKGDPKHTVLKSLGDKGDPKHTVAESLGGKDDPKHTIIKSVGQPKHGTLQSQIKVPDVVPIHTVAKSAVDKGIKDKHNTILSGVHNPIQSNLKDKADPVHSAIQSAIKDGKLKPKDPDPVHNPIQSNLKDKADPVHGAVQSAIKDGKLKPKDAEPVHSPIQSNLKGKTDPVHGAVQSAIKDGKLKPKDAEPVHSPIQSNLKGKTEPVHSPVQSNLKGKTEPVHSPVQSAVKDGKLKPVEPVHSAAETAAKLKPKDPTPIHSPAISNAAKPGVIKPIEPVHSQVQSAAKFKPKDVPTHSPGASNATKTIQVTPKFTPPPKEVKPLVLPKAAPAHTPQASHNPQVSAAAAKKAPTKKGDKDN